MAKGRRYELDELLIRPGTYFNPQTEVLVVVDDSPSLDNEIFNMEEFEGADWILITDEVPLDESRRDEELEGFQAQYHGGDGRSSAARALEDDDDLDLDDEDDDAEARARDIEEGDAPLDEDEDDLL